MRVLVLLAAIACVALAVTPQKKNVYGKRSQVKQNVKFNVLSQDRPDTYFLNVENPTPEEYVAAPRFPIVPTPGPIAMDILGQMYKAGNISNGTGVPKPTNIWQKNLWGFEWKDWSNWGAVMPYPYIVSPRSFNINFMYPSNPVHFDQNGRMLEGFFQPAPDANPPIYNTSYPYMVMSAAFDLGLLIKNGDNVVLKSITPLGATVEYQDSTQGNRTVARLYLVKGSPLVSIECFNATLAFGSLVVGVPIVIGVNDAPPGSTISDTHFKFQMAVGPSHPEGQWWHAYFSSRVSMFLALPPVGPVNLTAPFSGTVQIGCGTLDNVMEDFLSSAAGVYAKDVQISYDVDQKNDKANVTFTYVLGGNTNQPYYHLALPHHGKLLGRQNTKPTNYWSVKGNMTAVQGNKWVLQYNLTKQGFGDNLAVDPQYKQAVLQQALFDYKLSMSRCPGDNATWGFPGYMNMELYAYTRDLAQYIDIAVVLENLGRRDLAVNLTKQVLYCYQYVLKRPTQAPQPCPLPINNTAVCVRSQTDVFYDTKWGGLVTNWYNRFAEHYCQCDKPGGPSACIGYNYCDNLDGWSAFANYGNPFYNDHHFQYGYIVKTLAWVVYYQQIKQAPLGLTTKNITDITKIAYLFARDYANPSTDDKFFTFARQKDFYDGHSWAEGYSYSGRMLLWLNQQSGGESVNSYYALHLLGLATGDDNVGDWGRIQLAMEMQSLSTYTHLRNDTKAQQTGENYIPDRWFNEQVRCLSILQGNAGSGATYYGPNQIFECGITFLPVTPITREFLKKDWAQGAYYWMDWHGNKTGNCVYPDPLTQPQNPCPGLFNSTWWDNAYGCCATDDGYPNNQWRAWPDWFPYKYLVLSVYDPQSAWSKLQMPDLTKPNPPNLPFPYVNNRNEVVGYQHDLTRTSALFSVATAKNYKE